MKEKLNERGKTVPLVLDSFAIIVLYLAQPGWEQVHKHLTDAVNGGYSHVMSPSNYGEVYYTILRRRGESALAEVLAMIEKMPIEIVIPEFRDYVAAARLKGLHGASYSDCFAATLALERDLPVLTGDREFERLEPPMAMLKFSYPPIRSFCMTTNADIEAFVRAIAQQFSPRKIILFGSYAYGIPTPDSDVDLLVIMDHTKRNVEQAIEIRSAIRRSFPLDLFVRRPSDVAHRLEIGDSFIGDILHRGSILYEANHRGMD